MSQVTLLDGRHTYAGDDSCTLPDIGAANFQQHMFIICNHPTNSEIIGRSQTAGTPCATVKLLARTDGNAKTVFNTSGCMQIIGRHEYLANIELIKNST